MKVSVAMPVYNGALFLKEALDSIFAQTFNDFEVVAVDDKSTDATLELLRSIDDPRLRVIALERNLGHPGATQKAIEQCRGEYIIRCDADDIDHPERFAKQVAYMDAHPEVGVSGTRLQLFGDSSVIRKYPLDNASCQARLLFNTPVPDCGCIIRRSVLQANNIRFNANGPRVGGDWLFMIDLAAVTRFGNLDEALLFYGRGTHNISGPDRAPASRRQTVRIVLQSFGLEGTPEQVDVHLACMSTQERTSPGLVRDLRAWLQRLEQVNRSLGRCPDATFREEAQRRWRKFFFSVARADRRTLWTYIKLNGGLPRDLWMYLLKIRLAAFMGNR
jgi:glycosyltransferase involved in cell wall biosynthesis